MNDRGDAMGTDAMRGVVDAAVAECARHQSAMDGAADLPAALLEEDRHQAAMTGLTSAMLAARDQMMSGGLTSGGMMGGAGMYACPMNAP
jgi:gamma-glutamyl:cysteine ligase YbdK (ATP-grasp superfamily)